jgi:hypothetical protein
VISAGSKAFREPGKNMSGTGVLGYTVSGLVRSETASLNELDLGMWRAEAAA